MAQLVEFSRGVSGRLSDGIGYLMKKNGIDVITGTARLTGKGVVGVRETADSGSPLTEYRADHIVLATGARPRSVPGVTPDGDRVWTYFDALVPRDLPKSLLVIGSGAIGVEFASLYHDLGSEVTLVELAPQIMPVEDAAVAGHVRRQFEKRGIEIHTGASVSELTVGADSVAVTVRSADGTLEQRVVERVLVAAGIQATSRMWDSRTSASRSTVASSPPTSGAARPHSGSTLSATSQAPRASPQGRPRRRAVCRQAGGVAHVTPLDKDYVPGARTPGPRSPASASPRTRRGRPVVPCRSGSSICSLRQGARHR